jgi:hypothetical protein
MLNDGGHQSALHFVSYQLKLNYSFWPKCTTQADKRLSLLPQNYLQFTDRHVVFPVHMLTFLFYG